MSEHDLEKLLGGFAADTLTAEEREQLYTAALNNQQLFNTLADEQALKELLADPAVRRKLLASLDQKSASRADGSLSWPDWFRRPVGLAFAGGLAAAALAVMLGVRIYQDSLKQAAQSVATEEAKPTSQPATPQAVEPKTKANEHVAPMIDVRKKDAVIDTSADRKQSAPPPSKNEQTADVAQDNLKKRTEQENVHRETTASVAALSARALFYGGEPDRADTRSTAKEQEQPMKPLAESPPHASRLERKSEGLIQPGKAAGIAAQLKPLGLRYSFVIRGTDGQEQEVAAAALNNSPSGVLTVEANQDAYLQVWKTTGSSTAQLLWPKKETGRIYLKMAAHQRERIPLPMENGPVTLMALLSLTPPGPTMKRDGVLYDRLSLKQLQESITASNRTGQQEHAAYIVNPDPSTTAQVAVDIPLNR